MRIERVIASTFVGERKVMLDGPNSLIVEALRQYVKEDTMAPAISVFSDPLTMTHLAQSVIGEYRGLVTRRDWILARYTLEQMILQGIAPVPALARTAKKMLALQAWPGTQQVVLDCTLGMLAASGGVLWEDGLATTMRCESLYPVPRALAGYVAEATASSVQIGVLDLPAGRRIEPATVIKSVKGAAEVIASTLTASIQEKALAMRVFDVVTNLHTDLEPRLDKTPYLQLLACANFVTDVLPPQLPPILEAMLIASHAPRAIAALMGHPALRFMMASEALGMYKIERVFSGRTSAVVYSMLSKSYPDTIKPTVMISHVKSDPIGEIVSTASVPQSTGAIDRMLNAVGAFATSVAEVLPAAMGEANPVRALYTGVSAVEQTIVTALAATDVSYVAAPAESSKDTDRPMIERRLFTFTRDDRITNYEDMVAARANGEISTAEPTTVLRLVQPWAPAGTYPVRETPLSSQFTGRVLFTQPLDLSNAIAPTRKVSFTLVMPVYKNTPDGIRPVETKRVKVSMSLHSLAGLEPIDSYYLLLDSVTLARLAAQLDSLTIWYHAVAALDEVSDTTELGRVRLIYNDPGRLWGPNKEVGTTIAQTAKNTTQVMLINALLGLVTSPAVDDVYAQAAKQQLVPYTQPRLPMEVDAKLKTAQIILSKYFFELLALPDVFRELVNKMFASDMFKLLAHARMMKGGVSENPTVQR
jgi:hypothetical protein